MKVITDYKEKLEFLNSIEPNKKFKAIYKVEENEKNVVHPQTHRCVVEDGESVFVFSYGKTKYGFRRDKEYFAKHYNILSLPSEVDENTAWQRRMRRAVKCMNTSGLWTEIKKVFEQILYSGMTLEDKKALYELYENYDSPAKDFSEEEKAKAFLPYLRKFPFVFYEDNKGCLHIDTEYIWELSDCKLKSMYFGKYANQRIKAELQQAIKNKNDYSAGQTVSYDVSVNYQAKDNKAWYSEEFRNCGNGHYYLALDHSTAVFYEND